MNDQNFRLAFRIGGIIFLLVLLLQIWPYVVAVLALIGAATIYERSKKH